MVDLIRNRAGLVTAAVLLVPMLSSWGEEPPAINPFSPRVTQREDALPGYLELFDGSVHPGRLYLTRDARLKIFDDQKKQHREFPLSAIQRIDCTVKQEWFEKEWRFKENASDEKYFTGRTYPAREYIHKITFRDSRTIQGPLSGIVYVQGESNDEARKFLLHKRDKGAPGTDLKSLLYVRSIRLGDDALEEGRRRAAKNRAKPSGAASAGTTRR
jgi:hypothetical protein